MDRWVKFSIHYAAYHGYVSLGVCGLGVICNVFNIIVLTRANMISTTNYILTALAMSDLLTMLSYIPFALQFYVMHGLEPSAVRNSQPWAHFFLFHVNFTVTTHTTSIWLGVVLSVFRYAYVHLGGARGDGTFSCGFHRAKHAVVAVYLGSIILLVPNYLSLTVRSHSHYNERSNTSEELYDIVSIDTNGAYGHRVTTVNFWIHAVVIKLIPCALMLLFGLLLISTMRHSHRKSARLRTSSTRMQLQRQRLREHQRTTSMLVVIIILFLLTELPQGILALCSGLRPGFFEDYYVPLGDVMDIVALVNNGINFTLYCSMSKQFRTTFLQLFCPQCLPPDKRKRPIPPSPVRSDKISYLEFSLLAFVLRPHCTYGVALEV
ncbi:hypothetical protein CAPTEDRAFT_89325 [Capitella teleta]|uniref:G-protein coupled receptors family 1 profile domain-containing protein n=1 Tax=Capitella teleta TaxID=283909 RepID=R7TBV7_CAPTE|nr:hypothetical protein CAPTEDRAFT_89325 [Capitella teleta]|eukprot:ELT88581.1 hypothetical protein CAPTEDRAFT_89325 [Capitella teleta]